MFDTGPLFYYMEQGKKNCAPNGYAKADRPLLIVGTGLVPVPTGLYKFSALRKTRLPHIQHLISNVQRLIYLFRPICGLFAEIGER